MNSDPPRLLEDPSAAASLRQDLAHVDGATLEGLDLAAGLEQLRAATAATTATVPVAASGTGLSLAGKVGVGAAIAVAVALWVTRAEPDARQVEVASEAPRVTAPTLRDTRPPSVEEAQESEVSRPGAESAHSAAGLGSAQDAAEPAEAEPAEAEEPTQAEAAPVGSDPRVSPTNGPHRGSPPQRAAAPSNPAPAADLAADSAIDPAPPSDEIGDGVLREARMVARARASLAADPARAFELAEQAERDFPEGQLIEERRAIAIAALVALGRMDEARPRAQRFLARFSRGAHADAVRRALSDD